MPDEVGNITGITVIDHLTWGDQLHRFSEDWRLYMGIAYGNEMSTN